METDKWQLQFKKGIIELMIMLIIKERAYYGYELTVALKDTMYLGLSDGAIYPILKRLEKSGWTYSYWDTPEEGLRRRYYQLTEAGAAALEKRLEVFHYSAEMFLSIKGGD